MRHGYLEQMGKSPHLQRVRKRISQERGKIMSKELLPSLQELADLAQRLIELTQEEGK